MDKKDKIDTLIDQYLNFYQHGSQAIEPQQSTDFDSLMNQYKSNFDKQIAYELDVSEATIKAHVTAIFRKLGVQNRTQAVLAISALNIEDKKI